MILLYILFGEDYPPAKNAFIPLPGTVEDKNVSELIFVKGLQEKGKEKDSVALRMIDYIEKETGEKTRIISSFFNV